jgi:major capsid protein E
MADRLEDLRVVDPVLTTIARGYSNNAYVAEWIFPEVKVPKETGKIVHFGRDNFKVYNTERALRANSNRMPVGKRTTSGFTLTEHDLEYPIDYRELKEDMFNQQEAGTIAVTEGLKLKQEVMAAALATNPANYPAENTDALTGTDRWDDPGSHPLVQIEDASNTIRSRTGRRPNTILFSPSAFNSLKVHEDLRELIKYSQKGVLTLDLIKELIGIQNAAVGEAIQTDDDGEEFTDVWGKNVILAYIPPNPAGNRSLYEPSFGYTVRLENTLEIDTREENGGKLHLVRNTDIFDEFLVGPDAGFLFTDVTG